MIKIPPKENFVSSKIVDLEDCINAINALKMRGNNVGLSVGGFDLVTPGHMVHFELARRMCDFLVVVLTSDYYLSKRKGSGRPIYPEVLRAYAISQLNSVDLVTISNYRTAMEVLTVLKPTVYFKGPDFRDKFTPELIAEKRLVERNGGKLVITGPDAREDITTTSIIQYIKNELDIKKVLLCVDRDGTLIEDKHFLGRNENWREEINYNEELINFMLYMQAKSWLTSVVVSNQAGVALGYFNEGCVEEINHTLNLYLQARGVKIHSWQYEPFVDEDYVAKHKDKQFVARYIQTKTRRKPSIEMVLEGVKQAGERLEDFGKIIVIGNRDNDKNLAVNLKAQFIDVGNKKYDDLVKEVDSI